MWLLFPLSLSVFNVNVWGALEVGLGFVVAGPIEFIGVVNGGLGLGGTGSRSRLRGCCSHRVYQCCQMGNLFVSDFGTCILCLNNYR